MDTPRSSTGDALVARSTVRKLVRTLSTLDKRKRPGADAGFTAPVTAKESR